MDGTQKNTFAAVDVYSLAESYPEYRLTQEDALEAVQSVFGDRVSGSTPEATRLVHAFERAGVRTRATCFPKEWYLREHSWPERMDAFRQHALKLLVSAAKEAISKSGLTADRIDSVVTVSTTGVSTPSLDAHILEPLGLRADVTRTPIFGLGCAGGVNGFARAADLARARPGTIVLLLVVELCSLTFRPQDTGKANIIGTALFGDGAAAMILCCQSEESNGPTAPIRHLGGMEVTLPNSLDVMGWSIEEDGLGVVFSKDIPSIVSQELPALRGKFLNAFSIKFEDLGGIVAHPGGAKVLDAYDRALNLDSDALTVSRDVLRTYGNTSAVSVLSVLKNTKSRGLHLMIALGPGFTAGLGLVELNDVI